MHLQDISLPQCHSFPMRICKSLRQNQTQTGRKSRQPADEPFSRRIDTTHLCHHRVLNLLHRIFSQCFSMPSRSWSASIFSGSAFPVFAILDAQLESRLEFRVFHQLVKVSSSTGSSSSLPQASSASSFSKAFSMPSASCSESSF